ncbi:hypothetical protein AGABI2DRAFT_227062, partial [Agaricus bisporus var. bisporus H97]|uniref:hypothetical protein n=1 Tax=Agaricus bisporus var. bisporus (strain H97 / ATCC MYA-4626 / FGSC 10389) TaxID=936046 RepID=UPI00029F6ED6
MPRVANTDQTFKKSSVVVGQPAVTDHNINDDYVKDPPQNTDNSIERTGNSGLKEGNPKEPREPGAPEDAQLGKVTKEADLAEIAQEDSVH